MANLKSQIKRNRQNKKRHERNKARQSKMRSRVRVFEDAVAAGDEPAAREALSDAMSAIDKAAARGVIHKNKAARKKSQLARALDEL